MGERRLIRECTLVEVVFPIATLKQLPTGAKESECVCKKSYFTR
jgi:hypothetical protein